ncbi:MAG: galactose-1-epimerase, partial [Bacteroidota bacterium]|nr:galactose-1-epimerase [Bacteroidota bacterium]
FYSGNFLDNSLTSKTGGNYRKWSGLCLETQHFPNSPNNDKFPLTILRPGDKFYSETWFKFSVIKDIIDD